MLSRTLQNLRWSDKCHATSKAATVPLIVQYACTVVLPSIPTKYLTSTLKPPTLLTSSAFLVCSKILEREGFWEEPTLIPYFWESFAVVHREIWGNRSKLKLLHYSLITSYSSIIAQLFLEIIQLFLEFLFRTKKFLHWIMWIDGPNN